MFAHVADRLEGRHHFVPAGILSRHREIALSFAYGTRYVNRAEAIEVDPVALPLERARQAPGSPWSPLPNLEEFGGIRDAAPDSWGRRVIEAKLNVPPNSLDEFTYLLEAGSDRVGALDVRQTLTAPASNVAGSFFDLEYLLQAAAAVEEGEPIPRKLVPYLAGAPSAGGARPKASVRDESGVLWLAKFPSKNDRMDMAVLEAGALELARAAGLTVPPVKVIQVAKQPVLLIRRFDRYWARAGEPLAAMARGYDTDPRDPRDGWTEGRIAQVSALTLMGCSEMESITKGYRDLAQTIRERVHPRCVVRDTEELFARLVLNIFLTNDDDHLRNHAFSYDTEIKGWRLSPLYDVVPRPSVSQDRRLHLNVGAEGKLANLDNAMSEYRAFVSDRPAAISIVRRVWSAVRAWKGVYEGVGATPTLIAALEQAIRPLADIASAGLEAEIRR